MDTKKKQNIPITSGKGVSGTALSSLHPVSDMEKIFERFLGRRWPALMRWHDFPLMGSMLDEMGLRLPSLDVIDRDNEVLVRAEIPGVDKKDLEVSVTENLLTIKGESRKESKEEKGDYHRHEISSSSFARSVTLPGAVDSSQAKASLKDGILEITMPKLESSKRRSISVQ